MGRFSEVVFGRRELPVRCLIYAGAYLPIRKDWVRSLFDSWQKVQGQWVKFTFAHKNGAEYLVVFNVYGASMILEIVQVLKEGNAKKVFFIGSLGGKELPVGTLVLPTRIVDKTGFVAVDDPDKQFVQPEEYRLKRLRRALDDSGEVYVEGEIVSVQCVLHNIEHLRSFVEQEEGVIGVECETSTYYHYTQKEKLESYGLLYISDNKKTRNQHWRQESTECEKKISKKDNLHSHYSHGIVRQGCEPISCTLKLQLPFQGVFSR